jgi:hypothetical protein
MPQQKQPITQRPKVEDESIGNPREKHGLHRQRDEALPGKGGDKAGLNKYSVAGGTKQNTGRPKGPKLSESKKQGKPGHGRGPAFD